MILPPPVFKDLKARGRINISERDACERKTDFSCIECGFTDEEGEGEEAKSETNGMYNYGKTSMIDDKARVVKGGSWKDRAFYLSPGQRRYLDQNQSASWIGFRCAMDRVGSREQ